MENKDYKKMIEMANKALEGLNLDDALKTKAFEKVLDDLLGVNKNQEVMKTTNKKSQNKKKTTNSNSPKKKEAEEDKTTEIIAKLKAEDFDKIYKMDKGLDYSLYLLKVLREKYEIDGLIPSQIARILSDKFRIKTNQFSIGMALMKAKEYVDRHKVVTRGGSAYKYRIMANGEKYIEEVETQQDNDHTGLPAERSKPDLSCEVSGDSSELAN
ncbi:MAG: hypothetical protein ABIG37_02290 [Nanoarchaeota archaeon]